MKMNFPHFICKKERSTTKKWESLMLLAELACQERDKLLLLLHHHHPNPKNQENAEEEQKTTSGTKKRKKMMMGDYNHEEEKTTIQFKKAKKLVRDYDPQGKEENTHIQFKKAKKMKGKNLSEQKQKKAIRDHVDPEPEPAPHSSLETQYRNMVSTNDYGLIHVCHKTLTKTDVDRGQNRLLLPTKAVHDTLLPAFGYSLKDEKGVLHAPGIAVIGLDPLGRAWNLRWKFWTKYHVLDGQWKNLVDTNGLKARLHSIHVTAFRYGEANRQICFVITSSPCSDYASASASASTSASQEQATPSGQQQGRTAELLKMAG